MCRVKRPYWVKARRNSGKSSVSKAPIFSGMGPRLQVRWLRPPRSTTTVESASMSGALASAKRVRFERSPRASSKARPRTRPASSTVWWSSTQVSPFASTRRSMPEWCARRWRRWSKKPTPVEISALPEPSSWISTLTEVSAVSRSALPLRTIVPPFAAQTHHDALGVVLEALEAREALDVRTERREGPVGVVNVVGPNREVMGAEGRGPAGRPPSRQGVGGARAVVGERHGARVAYGNHPDRVEILEYRLAVVLGDHVRVLGGVEVGDLNGLGEVAHVDQGDKVGGLP